MRVTGSQIVGDQWRVSEMHAKNMGACLPLPSFAPFYFRVPAFPRGLDYLGARNRLFILRLRVVPHFSSGIVERAKRERAWKSPHARKGYTQWGKRKICLSPPRLAFLVWRDFHARSRFARSIPEEKWGTTRSLIYSPRPLLEVRKRENSIVIFISFKLDIPFIRQWFSIQFALI